MAAAIDNLIVSKKLNFTVIEGNRRVTSIKLLLDTKLRTSLKISGLYPTVTDSHIKADISKIPCIIYEKREEVSSYLGVRHIAGLLKWEAFAKAVYISNSIDADCLSSKSIDKAIKDIQDDVADRSDTIKNNMFHLDYLNKQDRIRRF